MDVRDYRDIIGGALLILIGTLTAIYALKTLSLGTIGQMGPGMFPFALGCMLVALGVFILVLGTLRPTGGLPSVDARSFMTVLGSILTFAVVVRPFGMIPAVFALTMVASRADNKLTLGKAAVIGIVASLGMTLLFRIGLGMHVAAIAWPW